MGAPSGPGQPGPSGPGIGQPILDPNQMAAEMGEMAIRNKLVTEAYGTVAPQRKVPNDYNKN